MHWKEQILHLILAQKSREAMKGGKLGMTNGQMTLSRELHTRSIRRNACKDRLIHEILEKFSPFFFSDRTESEIDSEQGSPAGPRGSDINYLAGRPDLEKFSLFFLRSDRKRDRLGAGQPRRPADLLFWPAARREPKKRRAATIGAPIKAGGKIV